MRRNPEAGRSVSCGPRTLLATLFAVPLVVAGVVAVLAAPEPGPPEEPADGAERLVTSAPTGDAERAPTEGAERIASRRPNHEPGRERAQRSTDGRASRSRREGREVELATTVTLVVRGTASKVETEAATVGDLLDDVALELSEHDRVRPPLDTPLGSGARVVVEVVDVETRVDTEVIAHETQRRETSERERGAEVVVQDGQDGKVETSIERVIVDGFEESETVVDESVTDPVTKVVEIGTAPPPEPEPKPEPKTASSGGDAWDRLAQCESNGNWSANTGNGYYGGLQFHAQTWRAHGGGEYASYAHQASREQQIVIARRVQKSQGWKAWPHCSRVVGLR